MLRRLLWVAVAALVPLTASATVVLAMSMEEMTARVPVVVRGTVHRVDPQWTEGRTGIWTYAEVVVKESLKGGTRTTVLVKQPGGTMGEVSMRVAGAAAFTPGEDVVLFLEPAVDEANTFVLHSMAASKVTLQNRRGVQVALRDLSGLSFARYGEKNLVQPVDEREVLGTAEAFLARVRTAAKGGAR
ncbi:MAG: hypothetical protein MUC96_03560 [Myxococcaceae bacterium]|jgi:hypothetical protein|nr:hypothetical protein [Myxococcaceae bacterium]